MNCQDNDVRTAKPVEQTWPENAPLPENPSHGADRWERVVSSLRLLVLTLALFATVLSLAAALVGPSTP